MCGICGVVGGIDLATLERMRDSMVHRGPDAKGHYLDEQVGLGVRRLSIIDLPGGRQPIANEDGTVWVAFNGEIYNYRQLRETLLKRGHQFSTGSDTEVLVHLYEEYGPEGVHLLRGMFAYAIWDVRRRRLLLVRDRIGIKPLYYTLTRNGLAFASEVKALLEHPWIVAEPDLAALDMYLTFQYVPGPRTMFAGIQKLPPGHWLTFENGRCEVRRYWNLMFWEGDRRVDLADAALEFRERFTESVKLHMVSDVSLGVLLSGGIDSAAVVGQMAEASSRVRTFTVGFDIPGLHNELDEARAVAQRFGTDHHEIVVSANAADLLPKLSWHMDEPVADAAALPTYLLCRFARSHVKVVLTGEGGDELLAGYPRYAWFMMATALRRYLPVSLRNRLLLPAALGLAWNERMRKGARNVLQEATDAERHVRWISNFSRDLKASIVAPEIRRAAGDDAPERFIGQYLEGSHRDSVGLVHALMEVDMRTWLVDDVLTRTDKMSMATSVEARVPFLDHQLLEFVSALPISTKLRNLGAKRLLRQAMRGVLPAQTLRRRKHAFVVPVDEWLRGPLRTFMSDTLLSSQLNARGWLQRKPLTALIDAHVAGRGSYGQPLWNLLCLELWAQAFLDAPVGQA